MRLIQASTLALLLWAGACRDEPRTMSQELSVAGMTCDACVQGITYEVERIEGVHSVAVDLEAGRATVVFTEGAVEPAAIEAAIDKLGYEATLAGAAAPAEPSGSSASPAS